MPPNPPSEETRVFRHWITGKYYNIEVSSGSSDPDSKFSARLFVDNELVCILPSIDGACPLRWSGLLKCHVSPSSKISLRLCKTTNGRPRYFSYPPFTISELDEETGEATMELPAAAWVVSIKSLTPAVAEYLFPEEIEIFNAIHGSYSDLEPNATLKYLFKNVLTFANIVAEARPESTAKISFLIYMNAWKLIDQQDQLDDSIRAILRGLTRIRDLTEIAGQASTETLASSIEQAKEPIKGILALLEDMSVYIIDRLF
ncbi:hypothetical protein BN14_12182 [Rhizoctonia solani AG-1 IB]|uniref:Uncharacterized protein n=1 Tax=Thanatephorus cucumeris (strain AG1-IB / isolate 7/3/14) TaxID=1108050 RepID=M5CFE3_THACB|nr:hypothetical protein BN14_12182 [Rhizoctonia solani AG-1 IB]